MCTTYYANVYNILCKCEKTCNAVRKTHKTCIEHIMQI